MITILDATKSLTSLVNDNTNGIGKIQPLEAFVTEELNGIYEAEIVLLQTDKHFKDLALNGLLKINAGEVIGEQIFRIYFISKPIDGKIVVKAQHISYDLNKIPVKPFTATGAVMTKNKLMENVIGTYPFDMMTDITNTTSVFTLDIPRNFRECLGGWEGSVLDTFRCEYEWDNLLVKMLAHRGTDEGVRIAYGKNLTDFKQEENMENVYTSVLGYAVVNDQTYLGNVYHKVTSNLPKVLIVDFSNNFNDETPTTERLTQLAQDYATRNAIEVPNVSIDVKFVPLYQTEEYKNIAPLERVALGDTVHVFFEKMNVEATSRVVKTVWNVILNKYESVELGDTKANLTTLLDDAVQEAKQNITIDAGFVETEMQEMSQLIINGLGLHRTLVPLSTGGYRMYLHNKPTLAESDTQYVIGAEGFMISQDYGQTWNSGWDASGNAVMNSLATITLRALEIYGSYLCFGEYPDGKYIEATTYSIGDVQQGVTFDGTGTIRMQPQEAFYVNNRTTDGQNNYNQITLNRVGSTYQSNYIELANYDDTNDFLLSNLIDMNAHLTTSTQTYNRLLLYNYQTDTGVRYNGNNITMRSGNGVNNLALNNYKTSSQNVSNTISLNGTATYVTLNLYNYKLNDTTVANSIGLQSTPTTSSASMFNYSFNTNTYVNTLNLGSNSTSNYTRFNNKQLNNPSYDSGLIYMNAQQNHNSLTIETRDFNNRNANNLSMGVNNNDIRYFNLYNYGSDGSYANTIAMSENAGLSLKSQKGDIYITSTNGSVYINNNKLSFSGGYVRYS